MSDPFYVTQPGLLPDSVSVVRVHDGRSFVVCDIVWRGGRWKADDLADALRKTLNSMENRAAAQRDMEAGK